MRTNLFVCPLLAAASVTAQARVWIRHDLARPIAAAASATAPGAPRPVGGNLPCRTLPAAVQGQPLAGGGALAPLVWANPAVTNRGGAAAFVAGIAGSSRNQGVFVADGAGVRAIAIGSGGGGGSGAPGTAGDPAPGGGTFAGFFTGTAFAPSIDEAGDVLFLADVAAGPSPRGLFLHRAASRSIVAVATVGSAFLAVGPGVLAESGADAGAVAFVARAAGRTQAELFCWRNGTVRSLAAVGDPAPGGGTFAALVTESLQFVDGTSVPIGPLPAIDGCGGAAFRAHTSGGPSAGGIVVRRGGVDVWYVQIGAPTPAGGSYVAFAAPLWNADGTIAVFADHTALGGVTSGWFVGRPGAFRRALGFFDPVDGGQCLGIAVSRGPMTPLDDAGNLVLWCDLALQGGQDRVVVCRRDGTIDVVARRGDPTPAGGVYGALNPWPSAGAAGAVVVPARVQGGAAASGYFRAAFCTPAVTAIPCSSVGTSVRVDATGPGGAVFALAASTRATSQPLPPFGTLEIGPVPLFWLLPLTPYPGPGEPHSSRWPVPDDPALVGSTLFFQTLTLATTASVLSGNAATALWQ